MPTVRDLLARKKSHAAQGAAAPAADGTGAAPPGPDRVVTVAPTATVLEAARLMTARGIGGLVVPDGAGGPGGIFTERDVLRRVVNDGRDPATTPVSEVMTAPVLTVSPDTALDECRRLFTGRRIRHLPVVDGGTLCGVVTSGDLIAYEADEAKATIEHLEGYIYSGR